MWTDHADGDPLFTAVTELANQLQPEMLILGQDVANIGNRPLSFGRVDQIDRSIRPQRLKHRHAVFDAPHHMVLAGSEYGHLWFNELWNVDNTTHSWDGGST